MSKFAVLVNRNKVTSTKIFDTLEAARGFGESQKTIDTEVKVFCEVGLIALSAPLPYYVTVGNTPTVPKVAKQVSTKPVKQSATPKEKKHRKKRKKVSMQCRAKDCENKSKGPRFKFLCADHVEIKK